MNGSKTIVVRNHSSVSSEKVMGLVSVHQAGVLNPRSGHRALFRHQVDEANLTVKIREFPVLNRTEYIFSDDNWLPF